jgi:hypothetical protein
MAAPLQQGSYVDLKNCQIFLEDGYNVVGAVNLMAGYMAGATSIVIDGIPADTIIPVGVRVKFTGSDAEYYVTSTIETTGTTTTIVLDRGLVATVADNVVITFGPQVLEIKVGDGTLTYSETKNREYKMNRGRLDRVRDGDEAPMEISTTFAWTYIKAYSTDAIPQPEDCLKQRGVAAGWVSTGEACDPYSVNLVVLNTPTSCVGVTNPREKIVFPEFRYEKLDHDVKAGTISLSGKSNALEPIVTRLAAAL